MRITEIYTSIQGETQYAGLPCTLVRTTGCDLRCGYCDSAFAFHGGTDMTVDEIMAEVARLGGAAGAADRRGADAAARATGAGAAPHRRWLPGDDRDLGRPSTRHARRTPSCASLTSRRPVPGRRTGTAGICSRPAAGGRGEVRPGRRGRLPLGRRGSSGQHALGRPGGGAAVARPRPAGPQKLVAWMLRDRLPARLNLQLHKYIWEPETRGGCRRRDVMLRLELAKDLGDLFGTPVNGLISLFR